MAFDIPPGKLTPHHRSKQYIDVNTYDTPFCLAWPNTSIDGDLMAEKMRQHRDMRLKGSAELRAKVGELKLRLADERERMQKDFEEQVGRMGVCKRRRRDT